MNFERKFKIKRIKEFVYGRNGRGRMEGRWTGRQSERTQQEQS